MISVRWAHALGSESRVSDHVTSPSAHSFRFAFASHFASSCLVRIVSVPAPSLHQDRRIPSNRMLSDHSARRPSRKHTLPRTDSPFSARVAHSSRQSGSVGLGSGFHHPFKRTYAVYRMIFVCFSISFRPRRVTLHSSFSIFTLDVASSIPGLSLTLVTLAPNVVLLTTIQLNLFLPSDTAVHRSQRRAACRWQ
jgi:hypothetical protein